MERKVVNENWKTIYWETNAEILSAIKLHYKASQIVMLYQNAFIASDLAKSVKWDSKSMSYRSQLLGEREKMCIEVNLFQHRILVKNENQQILKYLESRESNISEIIEFLRDVVMHTGNDRYSIKLDFLNQLYPLDINDNSNWLVCMNEYQTLLVSELLCNADLMMKYILCKNKITGIPKIDIETMEYLLDIPIAYKDGKLETHFQIGLSLNTKLHKTPYFFVKLITNSKNDFNTTELEKLVLGNWEHSEFKGAYLPISSLNIINDKEKQSNSALFFFESAMEKLKRLI